MTPDEIARYCPACDPGFPKITTHSRSCEGQRPMNTATPQDTYDHTIGAGALSFGWWLGCETTGVSASGDVADDWQATLTAEDGDGDPKTVVVGHAQIMSAARKIIGDDGVPYVSDTARRQCRALVFDADDADFDAGTGDELLQAAVLGEVVFG